MKTTKKVGVLLLAAYLIIQGARVLLSPNLNLGSIEGLIALLGIAAAVFLILDR